MTDMKKPLVIFGIGENAQLAHYYFTTDSSYQVAAFTVDAEYLSGHEFEGLPVVPFEQVSTLYPPESYDFFVAVGYSKLNENRKQKFEAAKDMGYAMASYVSSRASILNEYKIGGNCFILEDNTIQPYVHIGNNVTLWSGNHIGHHSSIHDHCFITSHVVISGGITIGESCFIGVNATLRDHITIGEKCIVGAGALILGDTEPQGLYVGEATDRSRVPSSRIKRI